MATGFPKGGKIALESLSNTRDLGAIATKDGRHVLPRKLLRSGNLYHASMADQRVLQEECKLKTVIDLRDHTERKERPDIVLKGVEYYHIPVLDEETMGISREKGALEVLLDFQGDVEKLMEHQYEIFVRDRFSVKQYARFMDVLLHHEIGRAHV